MTAGTKILGTHVKFIRVGDNYTLPVAGVVARDSVPDDSDPAWIDLGAILDASIELDREVKEVWAPNVGKFELHDIVETKRGFTRGFVAQEMSAFALECLYGTEPLDELSEDFYALQGKTKKGWLLATRYDQNDTLVSRERAFVHLSVVGAVTLDSDISVVPFEARQLIVDSLNTLNIITEDGFFLTTEDGLRITTG